ncbi:MAG: penicillin acylase family protein [Acidilobaceae archaeon]
MRLRALGLILVALISIVLLIAPIVYPILIVFLDPFHGVAGSGLVGLPEGSIRAPGVPGEAVVYWDSAGVPHIIASTDEAGFYALGYISAYLRLFQMDLFRRLPQGRLAELVGSAGLDSDKLMRTLNLDDAIRDSWAKIKVLEDPDAESIVKAIEYYVRGVNDFISRVSIRDLPVEYRLLGLKPEPWSPEDVVAIQKLFTMMLAWDTDDLVLNELVRRWGLDIILDLDIVGRVKTTPQASCNHAIPWPGYNYTIALHSYSVIKSTPRFESSQQTLGFIERASRWINIVRGLGLSNNWIIGGAYTLSGKPIVANDPHLALTAPSLWMLIRIETPSVKVAGVTVAGAPVVIIGRNENIAWGFTNVMGDFVDFYYYKWSGDRYLYRGEWRDATRRFELIRVWDPVSRKYNIVNYTVLETIHGPVLESDGERYAVAFTGSTPSLELLFIWGINRAQSVADALKAQRYFTAPVQNFVVADTMGNIAYSPTGAFPQRLNMPVFKVGDVMLINRGFLPYNGSIGEGEWLGVIEYSKLPILLNPPTPYIVTANSKPWDGDCGLHIGWNWADRFRQDRIIQLLDEALRIKGKVSIEDVMRIQTDASTDLSLRVYLNLLLSLVGEPRGLEGEIVNNLRIWLREEASTSIDRWEPSIVLTWIWLFHRSLWSKIYGGESNVGFFRLEHAERLLELYIKGDSRAYKYLARGEAENIALNTLREALSILREYYKTGDYKKWIYGKIHYFNPQHPIVKGLSYTNIEAPGGPYSVNPAMPAIIDEVIGAPVRSGASVRLVADLSVKEINVALPGGNSGNPHSKYYQNHYQEYWAKNTYYKIVIGQEVKIYVSKLVIKGE